MKTFKKGATPREIIDALTKMCATKPDLMDKPVVIDRPLIAAQDEGEFFALGIIEVIGDQIAFGA
jgi:hypothetical protein